MYRASVRPSVRPSVCAVSRAWREQLTEWILRDGVLLILLLFGALPFCLLQLLTTRQRFHLWNTNRKSYLMSRFVPSMCRSGLKTEISKHVYV